MRKTKLNYSWLGGPLITENNYLNKIRKAHQFFLNSVYDHVPSDMVYFQNVCLMPGKE